MIKENNQIKFIVAENEDSLKVEIEKLVEPKYIISESDNINKENIFMISSFKNVKIIPIIYDYSFFVKINKELIQANSNMFHNEFILYESYDKLINSLSKITTK